MNSFASFDGTRIAYHDEGAGPAVVLLHGFGLDGLGDLAGGGDYTLEEEAMVLPEDWPVPNYLPKPLTMKAHAEEGVNVLERGEIVRGDLMSTQVIVARATGADPKTLAAVLRGALAEQVPPEALCKAEMPVLGEGHDRDPGVYARAPERANRVRR